MKLVLIESPYAGNIKENIKYAKKCVNDCLKRGEAPYASHLFFTQEGILDDAVEEERRLGIEAGLAWGKKADLIAVYTDFGITTGMEIGIDRHKVNCKNVVYRKLSKQRIREICDE